MQSTKPQENQTIIGGSREKVGAEHSRTPAVPENRPLIIHLEHQTTMAAASTRALLFSRITNHSNPHQKPPPHPYSHHRLIRPLLPYLSTAATSTSKKRPGSAAAISCLISDVDGGGVYDDFVLSTNSFYREFSVIANMLKKIEPLDTCMISKGVSDSVKDSMRQMVSTMLGLLPSDQFSVTVTVSKRPLVRLLASSLITGYTLWNAEYRIMLMRNFETSPIDMPKRLNSSDCDDALEDQIKENEELCDDSVEIEYNSKELKRLNLQSCLADLSPDDMSYIQELESELSKAKKDLHSQKQETTRIRHAKENSTDLLKYLRSLDTDMVNELSRPSSSEVKQVLQQLVHSTSTRLFKEEPVQQNFQNDNLIFSESRDYIAKLLFWCMLLGHRLRSLENRLYLSCNVGFL